MEQRDKSLSELLSAVIPIGVYRGVIVTKIIGGFSCLGVKCKTQTEVDNVIDKANQSIQKSVVK